jgi:hypothetical protein
MNAVVSNADTTAAHARRLLDELGRTGPDVAAALENGGHYGALEDCGTCPVAVYLLRCDLGLTEVLVDVGQIELTFSGGSTVYLDTPEPVGQFIQAFDNGAHPELVKDGAR